MSSQWYHEHCGVSNHRKLAWLTTEKTSKFRIACRLMIPLTKGQWCGKRFHVITSSYLAKTWLMNVLLLRSTEKTFEPTNLLPLLCSSILYIRACFLLIISCQSEKGLSQWYKTIHICLCVTSWHIGLDKWPESNHRQRNLKLVYIKQIPLTLICYHERFVITFDSLI